MNNKKTDDRMILVHNLRGIKTLEDVEKVVKRDLLIFDPIERVESKETKPFFYLRSKEIIHIIFAEDKSEAGHIFNL